MAQRGTEEWRRNVSHGNKGKTAWNKGLDKSDPRVAKYGASGSKAKKGTIPWNKGKKGVQVAWNKGKPWGKDTLEKISLALKGKKQPRGEDSPFWKGENIGYASLHNWVNQVLGKPDVCEFCGKAGFIGKNIDWANKSHEYKRDISDWLRLCKPCHRKYDKDYRNNID